MGALMMSRAEIDTLDLNITTIRTPDAALRLLQESGPDILEALRGAIVEIDELADRDVDHSGCVHGDDLDSVADDIGEIVDAMGAGEDRDKLTKLLSELRALT